MRGLAAVFAVAASAACENQVPTATGVDLFPGGVAPTSIVLELPAANFLAQDTVFQGFSNPRLTPYLLVANDFDGALDAHTLVRFTNFPDSVTYLVTGAARTEAISSFGPGRVITRVDTLASAPRTTTRFHLWALEQAWDSSTVTWEYAMDRPGNRVAWRTPGGTRGALLGEAVWTPGDTIRRDSLVWEVDSLAVRRMTEEGFPGLLITSTDPNTRFQLSQVSLSARVRPAGRTDTLVVAAIVNDGPQTFIFNPQVPTSTSVLRLGGLTGDRSVIRLDLDQTVPSCPPSQGTGCPSVRLRDVTLNNVQLVLDPVQVPSGFRPLAQTRVVLRRVAEPELGRFAPLAEVVAADTVSIGSFGLPNGTPLRLDLTSAVASRLASDSTSLTLALLSESVSPGVVDFGMLWFDRRPRLRLVYTMPLRPELP